MKLVKLTVRCLQQSLADKQNVFCRMFHKVSNTVCHLRKRQKLKISFKKS